MRRRILCLIVGVVLVAGSATWAEPRSQSVSDEEARQWIRHLVPLPKKITLTAKVVVPADGVAIVLPDDAPMLVRQAAKELRECLGAEARGSGASFTLRLRLGGPDAAPLKALPNRGQAYIISPTAGNEGLQLVGLEPHGVYYAAKTMQQFLKARAAGGRVDIPLATITDWPDMEDRGLWGGDSSEQLRWMSDRKMNYDEQISTTGVDDERRPYVRYAPFKQRMIDEGPTYGINPVPVVLHLEQISGHGLFKAHPELQGKDGRPGTICYSNPLFTDILSQWLLLWRSQPGVKEVDVWMTENLAGEKGCQCEQCRREDRSVLEARAIVAAWKKAREKQPDLGLRVLTSEETEKSNPKVFEELPPEVKIWYYHSLFTYNTSHRQMIRPYLVDAIRGGRWIGVCANVCALVGFWEPFTGAQFMHYRMNEFVDKKLSGLLGYAVPRLYHVRFNTEAAAEWSWNAKGRSPREFAVSWSVRQGLNDPEKFADWSDAVGPVAWDIYGSEFPSGEKRKIPGKLADLLRKGKLPELGFVLWDVYGLPWGEIKTVEQFDKDVAQADKGVELAREIGEPMFLQESLVIQGYIHALKALWQLKQIVRPEGVADADKDAARRHFQAYADGLGQARTALLAWEKALPMRPPDEHMMDQPVKLLQEMIDEMQAVAVDVGCGPKE